MRVALIDFDGTLYPHVPLMAEPDPMPGAADALRRLKAAGYEIVVFTARLSPRWLEAARYSAADQREYIERLLARDGIPYDAITGERRPASVVIDDEAIRFRDGEWPAIVDWLLFSEESAS